MEEQLKLQLNEIDAVDELNSSDDERDSEESIIYKKRIKTLISEIAKQEGFEGIQLSKEGLERIQITSKYLISMLIFNIIEELNRSTRRKISPYHVDKALDKILSNASSIDFVLNMLNNDIESLKELNNSTAISKTNKFINNDFI